MKILFVDVDGTLTTTKSGQTFKENPEDIKVIEGVEYALNLYKEKEYCIVGISNQGGVPRYKSLEETIEEMRNTLFLLPQLHSIIFAPGDGKYCYQVFREEFLDSTTQVFQSCFVKRNYRKPDYGMIEYFLYHNAKAATEEIEHCIMVGDREEDKLCADNAKIEFMDAITFQNLI